MQINYNLGYLLVIVSLEWCIVNLQLSHDYSQRFIESNSDHSWLRHLAYTCISHQGTWAHAIAIQAVTS